MEKIHAAFRAVADSVIDSLKEEDKTKYGPIARKEREFQALIEQQDFENYLISRLPADRYATIKEIDGIRTLIVDTVTIPQHILIEHSDKFQEAYEQMGGMAIGNRSGIAPALSSESGDVNEVYELNEGRLPRQLLSTFEAALVLRAVDRRKSLSRGTVYDWRGEIAEDYGSSGRDLQVAQHLISLCSTGYFDHGDVFDRIYTELVEQESMPLQEYKRDVARYVKENPFAVFVRADGMSGRDVYHMTRGKVEEIDEYPASPQFVEICGKGQNTHPIIDDARDLLSENCDFNMITRRNRSIDQKILRINIEHS
jgi:hypothetical protein